MKLGPINVHSRGATLDARGHRYLLVGTAAREGGGHNDPRALQVIRDDFKSVLLYVRWPRYWWPGPTRRAVRRFEARVHEAEGRHRAVRSSASGAVAVPTNSDWGPR